MANLASKKCVPCEGGTPPMEHDEIEKYIKNVEDWEVKDDKRIEKTFKFKTFMEGIRFVNEVARIAEQEGHHPDIHIRWRKVTFELSTHAIKGLSENDFIMASKIDQRYNWEEKFEKLMVAKLISVKILIALIIILIALLLWQKLF